MSSLRGDVAVPWSSNFFCTFISNQGMALPVWVGKIGIFWGEPQGSLVSKEKAGLNRNEWNENEQGSWVLCKPCYM